MRLIVKSVIHKLTLYDKVKKEGIGLLPIIVDILGRSETIPQGANDLCTSYAVKFGVDGTHLKVRTGNFLRLLESFQDVLTRWTVFIA